MASARGDLDATPGAAGMPSAAASSSSAASSATWRDPAVILDPKHTLAPYRGPKVEALLGPCVRLEGGEIRCIGEPHLPFPNELVRGAKGLATLTSHRTVDYGCVVLRSGRVACWGETYFHGPGERSCRWETNQAYLDSLLSEAPPPESCPKVHGDFNCLWKRRLCSEPVVTRDLTGIAEVWGSDGRTYGRSAQGALFCWGDNQSLGCGVYHPCEGGDWVREYCQQPQRLAIPPVARIAWTGDCAITQAGDVYCWGASPLTCVEKNRTGLPGWVQGSLPARQKRWSKVVQVFNTWPAGICVLQQSGRITCNTDDQSSRFSDLSGVIDVYPPCLRDAAGRVYCWDTYVPTEPVRRVPAIEGAIAISATPGGGCALLGDGGLYCWGHRDGNEFGPDEKRQYVPPLPVQFSP